MNHVMQQQRLISRYCKNTSLPTFNQNHVSFTLANKLLLKKSPNKNVVFSPLSIQVVLGVLAAGSSGRTLDELLIFLKTKNVHKLNAVSLHILLAIMVDGSMCGGPLESCVNGLWVDQTLSLNPSFRNVLVAVYWTASKQVDFKHKADKVVEEVNLWAEKRTNGLIKEVVSPDSFNSSTALVFANALYFKGVWSEKFDRSKTKNFDFYLGSDNVVSVPFMTTKEDQFMSALAS